MTRIRAIHVHHLDQIVIPERRSFNRTLIYRIETLNRRFDLSLIRNSWIDQDCFYQGYVNEDFTSSISINPCHGLVSRIDRLKSIPHPSIVWNICL